MTLIQLHRTLGRLQRKIDKQAVVADRHDVKAEFAAPGSEEIQKNREKSREIRGRILPELYTLLHHFQSRLPEHQVSRADTVARLLGLTRSA